MLSKQVSMRIEERIRSVDADKRQDIKETLQQVAGKSTLFNFNGKLNLLLCLLVVLLTMFLLRRFKSPKKVYHAMDPSMAF